MSRISIELPESQLQELTALGHADGRPRAALIREAIQAYLNLRQRADAAQAFGLWQAKRVDGLVFQQQIRSEW